MDSKLSDCERDLMEKWTNDVIHKTKPYHEPFLDSNATVTVKRICEKLSQDAYVFFHAVEMLEKYIDLKNAAHVVIDDPMLATATVVMLSAKYDKEQDLNLCDLQEVLHHETKYEYSIPTLRSAEVEVLKTLGTLQFHKVSDDMLTFIKMFEDVYQVKVSLVPLAIDTLELLYLNRRKLFFHLKEIYHSRSLFETLMCTRSYIPIGILGFLLRTSSYRHCFDVEGVLNSFSKVISIHMDHINLLIDKIKTIYEEK